MSGPPYLTDRAQAALPDIAKKTRSMLESATACKNKETAIRAMLNMDPHASRVGGGMPSFAAKLLGVALSPNVDADDIAYQEAHCALECGALSPEEKTLLDRELPRMRGLAQGIVGAAALDLPPDRVRAVLLARFINSRWDEGSMGENLHSGVRRVFERYFALIDGLQSVGNRLGFYTPQDVFAPVFASHGASAMRKLGPTEPGETIPATSRIVKR